MAHLDHLRSPHLALGLVCAVEACLVQPHADFGAVVRFSSFVQPIRCGFLGAVGGSALNAHRTGNAGAGAAERGEITAPLARVCTELTG